MPSAGRGWRRDARRGDCSSNQSARQSPGGPKPEASERGMRNAGTAELPGVRRDRMGPPLAALGLTSPRDFRGPIPNLCVNPSTAVAAARSPGNAARQPAVGRAYQSVAAALQGKAQFYSRDGVAHEAPLSLVWRVRKSARPACEPHASTRPAFPLGASLAQEPTPTSSK